MSVSGDSSVSMDPIVPVSAEKNPILSVRESHGIKPGVAHASAFSTELELASKDNGTTEKPSSPSGLDQRPGKVEALTHGDASQTKDAKEGTAGAEEPHDEHNLVETPSGLEASGKAGSKVSDAPEANDADDMNGPNAPKPSDGAEDKVVDELSDGDDVDEAMETIRYRYENMESRIQLAPKRLKQQQQYQKILEERVSLLEERFALYDKLQKPGTGLPPPPNPFGLPELPPLPRPQLAPKLGFKFWEDFKVNVFDGCIIDVLVGEPEIPRTEKARRKKATGSTSQSETLASSEYLPTEVAEKRVLDDEVAVLKGKQLPDRIRFNLIGIPRLFSKFFCNGNASEPDNVLLRPFKPLLQNVEEILELMVEISDAANNIIVQRANAESNEQPDADGVIVDGHAEGVVVDSQTSTAEHRDSLTSSYGAFNPFVAPPPSDPNEPEAHDALHLEEWQRILRDVDIFHCNECTKAIRADWPTKCELDKTFDVIRDLFNNYLLPVHSMFRKREVKRVSFRDLWHVFHTGDLVVTRPSAGSQENTMLGMRVLMTSGGRRVINPTVPPPLYGSAAGKLMAPDETEDVTVPINGVNPFCVYAYYLDYDGTRLVPVKRRFVIMPYADERKIVDLEVVPVAYADRPETVLEERGKKFVKFVTANTAPYVNCTGFDLETREELNDKVIVDLKSYFNTRPIEVPSYVGPGPLDTSETTDCTLGNDCSYLGTSMCYHRSMKIVFDQGSDMNIYNQYIEAKPEYNPYLDTQEANTWAPDYPICHYRVFAYKLQSREWVQANVQGLEPSFGTEMRKGFDLLVLSEDHKKILESQVREHFRKRGLQGHNRRTEDDMDLVRGKGQGLIILLHGAPGVGKTCTAECIAELVKKPLYPITCGDLGSTAEEVEKNLKKHFTLASTWDCVMLLDEADVFLAKRKTEDLHRNSIVSVFLRMLEYYKGLLFLTTNRVGAFDEAFKSRVHISLFYPNFDEDTTIKVWKTFIKQAKQKLKKEGRKNVNVDGHEIKKFAREHWEENPKARWNGRQIRNAFQTAVAMAEFHARETESAGNYDEKKDVKIKIGRDQFKMIAKTAREFDDYMTATIGDTFDGKAARTSMRKKDTEYKTGKPSKSKKKEDLDDSDDSDASTDDEGKEKSQSKKSKGKKSKSKKSKSKRKSSDSDSDDNSSHDSDSGEDDNGKSK